MSSILSKKQMTEEDIKLQYITPAIQGKWGLERMTMETKITDGRINLRGNLVSREKPKKADYVLYLNKGKTALEVEDAWVQNGNMVIMKFAGIDVIEKAQELRGKILYIDRDDVELEEGQHFVQDLIGMEVVDADDGHVYGKLTDVSKTGANDVYHITFPDGKVRLIPKIPQVVIDIDVEAEKMTIRPLEGLFDDEN